MVSCFVVQSPVDSSYFSLPHSTQAFAVVSIKAGTMESYFKSHPPSREDRGVTQHITGNLLPFSFPYIVHI